jgi:hypothetical protein
MVPKEQRMYPWDVEMSQTALKLEQEVDKTLLPLAQCVYWHVVRGTQLGHSLYTKAIINPAHRVAYLALYPGLPCPTIEEVKRAYEQAHLELDKLEKEWITTSSTKILPKSIRSLLPDRDSPTPVDASLALALGVLLGAAGDGECVPIVGATLPFPSLSDLRKVCPVVYENAKALRDRPISQLALRLLWGQLFANQTGKAIPPPRYSATLPWVKTATSLPPFVLRSMVISVFVLPMWFTLLTLWTRRVDVLIGLYVGCAATSFFLFQQTIGKLEAKDRAVPIRGFYFATLWMINNTCPENIQQKLRPIVDKVACNLLKEKPVEGITSSKSDNIAEANQSGTPILQNDAASDSEERSAQCLSESDESLVDPEFDVRKIGPFQPESTSGIDAADAALSNIQDPVSSPDDLSLVSEPTSSSVLTSDLDEMVGQKELSVLSTPALVQSETQIDCESDAADENLDPEADSKILNEQRKEIKHGFADENVVTNITNSQENLLNEKTGRPSISRIDSKSFEDEEVQGVL